VGPIFRSLLRNRIRTGLLVAEIAVTLAIVLNCFGLLIEARRDLTRPTGIDEANLVVVEMLPWDPAYRDAATRLEILRADVEALRALPGVLDATAMGPIPLQGGGSSGQVKALGAADESKVRAPVYWADERVISTLGLELVAGRDFTPDDVPVESGPAILNVIVTQALADAVFPDGDALGERLDTGSEEWPDVIVGVVKQMHTPYGGGPMEDRIMIYPRPRHHASFMSYLVRTEPEQLDGLLPVIEDTIRARDDRRVVAAKPLLEYKARGNALSRSLSGVLIVIIALLLGVTALGIFGMTSFAVAQRTREVGTRRALGASRLKVVIHFLTENAMVVISGTGLGLLGAVALNAALMSATDATALSPGLAAAGVMLLWVVGFLATIVPAVKASRLQPVLATRTV
jgi:putative ABC transport system permease protein